MDHSDYEALAHMLYRQQPTYKLYDQDAREAFTGSYRCGDKKGFEAHAFACLYDAREHLGIKDLYRCNSARVDGLVVMKGVDGFGGTLLEVKTTLSWATLSAALAAFVCGNEVLCNEGYLTYAESGGLIVFNNFAADWVRGDIDSMKSWAKLYRYLFEMMEGFPMAAMQLCPEGFYNPFMENNPKDGRIARLFRPYHFMATTSKEQPVLLEFAEGRRRSWQEKQRS